MDRLKNIELFNLDETVAYPLFKKFEYCYEVIPNIKDYILKLIPTLNPEEFTINGDIAIAKDADVSNLAVINGPTIIDHQAIIRPFAYIRGSVIVGKNCTIGNSSELKNAILFNRSAVPHFNYVGDSVLGYKSHIGAGVKISNLKSDSSNVNIKIDGKLVETNTKKVGAFLGDHVEVGCNAVLNPGTVIGKNSVVYPLSNVRGYVPEEHIYKEKGAIVRKEI
jgi:N-acetylglucosamine-1-phosphate uridyltransferase (contains nucleotidyltransferase and I-patch acetyltransferase domains)